jgi:mRNA-degrading endonuclease YafQ of YafQ-DinJ toxin-antitoxin module
MYEIRVTRQFIRATRKADRTSLEEARDELQRDPYHARGSHTLSHDWAGYRAAEFDGKDRIIYRICEECLQKRQEELQPLDCCSNPDRPLKIVTFVDFGDYHASAGRRRLRPAYPYSAEAPSPPDEIE